MHKVKQVFLRWLYARFLPLYPFIKEACKIVVNFILSGGLNLALCISGPV